MNLNDDEKVMLNEWSIKNLGWPCNSLDDYELALQAKKLKDGEEGALKIDVDEQVRRELDGAFSMMGLGAAVVLDGEKKTNVMVSLTPTARDRLVEMAFQLGFKHAGKGNISGLFEAISRGNMQIRVRSADVEGMNREFREERLEEIVKSLAELIDKINQLR